MYKLCMYMFKIFMYTYMLYDSAALTSKAVKYRPDLGVEPQVSRTITSALPTKLFKSYTFLLCNFMACF